MALPNLQKIVLGVTSGTDELGAVMQMMMRQAAANGPTDGL